MRVGGPRLCIGRTLPVRRTDSPYAHVTSNQWTRTLPTNGLIHFHPMDSRTSTQWTRALLPNGLAHFYPMDSRTSTQWTRALHAYDVSPPSVDRTSFDADGGIAGLGASRKCRPCLLTSQWAAADRAVGTGGKSGGHWMEKQWAPDENPVGTGNSHGGRRKIRACAVNLSAPTATAFAFAETAKIGSTTPRKSHFSIRPVPFRLGFN